MALLPLFLAVDGGPVGHTDRHAADLEGEDGGGTYRWITTQTFIENATYQTARSDLENATFDHPSPGRFTMRVAIDPDPVIVGIGHSDEDGNEVQARFQSFLIEAHEFESHGSFTVTDRHAGGILVTPNGDIELEGHWSAEGLRINVTAIEPRMFRLGIGDDA